MKIKKFNDELAWLEGRRGKITGTKADKLILKSGTGYKMGFYEIIAERVALPPTTENRMDRGKRLEEVAMELFAQKTKKKVNTDLVIWTRDDDENIAVSPDGSIGKTEAAEAKCLSSARHIEAWITNKVPDEFFYQGLQYFIVNEKLKTLYFVFYNPEMPKDIFWLTMHRKDLKEKIEEYLKLEKEVLVKISEIENQLTFD